MIGNSNQTDTNRARERRPYLFIQLTIVLAVFLALVAEPANASRTVLGKITDANNRPVQGLLVRAWDSDSGSSDDFMGQAYTDANGNYRIPYSSGHWDPAPHNITTWRPDIYIKVLVYADGNWIMTRRSGVTSDHPHRNNLTKNLSVPNNVTRTKYTQFRPIYHALPFRNHTRTVCGLPSCKEEHSPLSFLQDILTFEWALCGGMSLTALEDFRAGRKPAEFSPTMKARLVANQIRTVTSTIWAKFIEWQAKPTLPHTFSPHTIGFSTEGEWPKVRQAIDAGAPIILGLIRNQDATGDNVSRNHQSLAVGYSVNDLTTKVVIYLYDPNYCPNSLGPDCYSASGFSTFTFYTGIPQNQIKATFRDPDGNVVPRARGFFVIYRGSGPPTTTVYRPPVTATKTLVAQAQPAMQTSLMSISKVVRRGGEEPEDSTVIIDDSEASDEAVKAYLETVAEWDAEQDEVAASARLEQIQTARRNLVTTRSLEQDSPELEQLQRLVSPEQFDAPPPPK